ncbi:MAG: carbonic anhydrase [Actinomycetota bacterium]
MSFDWAEQPLLVLACMDPRVTPILPAGAFVVRTAGASPDPVSVDLGVAVDVKGVRSIAVVTHTDCAMRAPLSEDPAITARAIGDERSASRQTARALSERFPAVEVRAFVYRVEDGVLEPLT